MNVSLLAYFRNASFGGAKVGDTRSTVERLLGKPVVVVAGIDNKLTDYRAAGLWYFGGVQFDFDESDILKDIGFQPWYVREGSSYRSPEDITKLDTWIFQSNHEPSVDDLRVALRNESIDFQDTGWETCLYDEALKEFTVVDYQPDNVQDEHFGTLVLRSGISVRYAGDASITRVAANIDYWMIKGREQAIVW